MSVHITSYVWKRTFPTHSAKLVALKLADVAGDDGDHVYPSINTVAMECHLSPSTVRRAIADMRKSGVLVLVKRGANQGEKKVAAPLGNRKNNEYRFDLDKLLSLPLASQTFKENLKKEAEEGKNVSHSDQRSDETLVTMTNDVSHSDQRSHYIDSEPLIEPARAERVSSYLFEDFENKWPWYSHESRTASKRAWDKLSEDEQRQAVEGMGTYLGSKHPGGKRVKAPAYLADKIWLNRSAPTVSRSVFVVQGSAAWDYAVKRRNAQQGLVEDAKFSVTIDSKHPESDIPVKGWEWRITWFQGDLPDNVKAEENKTWWIIERSPDQG